MEIIKHERFGQLRVIQIEGEPWFAGKDVVEALGYKDLSHPLSDHVLPEDRVKVDVNRGGQFDLQSENQPVTTPPNMTTFINEAGLYSLILSSKLESAKEFKRWVTKEVLPSIRKHGMYATSDAIVKIKEDPNFLIGVLKALQDEQAKSKALAEENASIKPIADYGKMLHESNGTFDMAEAAKYLQNAGYKIGRNRLIKILLRRKAVLKNKFGYITPAQYTTQQGYFKLHSGAIIALPTGEEIISQKTLVTPKGLEWLTKILAL